MNFYKTLVRSTIGSNLPVESCVVFIHGLVGSTITWERFSNHLKKEWIFEDSFGLEYYQYTIELNIPIIDFFSKAIAGGPSIENIAKALKTVIDEECRDYKNVILIAHSMGGLVARQYLVDTVKVSKDVGKIKGLITYASPHKGSTLATWFKLIGRYLFFPFYLTSRQIVQMCRIQSDFIKKLNTDWDTLRIESKIDFTRVVGLRDFIVDPDSAALEWIDPNVKPISNKGHFNILKPRRSNDTAFMILFNYLKYFRSNLEKKIEQEELDKLAQEEQEEDQSI